MPNAPKRPCTFPRCAKLVDSGRCDDHKQQETRGNSTVRGYGYRHQLYRAWFFAQPENVICADCKREPATDLHHVKKVRDYPQLQYVASNGMGLCSTCHKVRTARGE